MIKTLEEALVVKERIELLLSQLCNVSQILVGMEKAERLLIFELCDFFK